MGAIEDHRMTTKVAGHETDATSVIVDNLDIWTSAIKNKSSAGRAGGSKRELYGIKKLRELILDLAVRGLLVPQDPNDEPASELLTRIAAEKTTLIKKGRVRKQKSLGAVSQAEHPFVLPAGWEWVRLQDVAYSQAGFAFKSKEFNEAGEGLPLIRIRDVGQPFSGTYYNGEYREEFLVKEGDFLISMDGNFRVSPWQGDPALLNQRVSRLIFFGVEIAPAFIADSLQIKLSELQGVKAYTTVDHLSGKQISESVIGLPPASEQYRIVAKVDELMALCDQLEQQTEASLTAHETLVEALLGALTNAADHTSFQQAWQRIAQHFDTLFTTEHSIDQLKQTILQLAVMGKLVPQAPNDEPASELLKRIAAEKAKLAKEGKIKKQKPLSDTSTEEHSIKLPKNWCFAHCLDICSKITDGEHSTPERSQAGHYLLSARNVTNEGIILGDVDYVPDHEFERIRKRCDPNIGDLLISCSGSVGRVSKVDRDNAYSMVRSAAMIRPFGSHLSIDYLAYALRSPFLQSQMVKKSKKTAQANLFLGAISSLTISIPPLPEQTRIVSKIEEMMGICDRLKAHLNHAQTTQLQLADALTEQVIA